MRAPRQPNAPKNDINVTPLVDVVLVLLIIFMVITPMLQKGAEVQLPLTEHPKKAKSLDEQITITVKKEGELYWETQPISDADLATRLSQTYSAMPTRPIFVKGDNAASYGRVRQVMKLVQDAGFTKVGVIVKELKEGGG